MTLPAIVSRRKPHPAMPCPHSTTRARCKPCALSANREATIRSNKRAMAARNERLANCGAFLEVVWTPDDSLAPGHTLSRAAVEAMLNDGHLEAGTCFESGGVVLTVGEGRLWARGRVKG